MKVQVVTKCGDRIIPNECELEVRVKYFLKTNLDTIYLGHPVVVASYCKLTRA